MAVVWPRNLTKIPDQHTDEIISIFFFFWQSLCDLAVPNQPFSRWWAQGPGPQRMTVRSAEEERKVWSWGCHRHWITLSQCSPAIVWGRGFVRSPLVKNRYISHVLLLSLLLIDWLIFFYLEGRWLRSCCHMSQWGDDGLQGRSAPIECRYRGGGMSARCAPL